MQGRPLCRPDFLLSANRVVTIQLADNGFVLPESLKYLNSQHP